ncbi:hypothetical protein [Curtobacterium sp. 9128]|uniref:hypothetical protein n=1 Tax=Curtobacterium sp. 9128 TaxID=1793722 RepID=UPI0011A08FCD|nr:hypothetical protein [Curtobacterium sp. 9128]
MLRHTIDSEFRICETTWAGIVGDGFGGTRSRSRRIRTTADVEGRRVVIDAPWSGLMQQAVEVRAEDAEPGTVFAHDGHPIRFRNREQGVTAFVRPSDLHNLTSEVASSE